MGAYPGTHQVTVSVDFKSDPPRVTNSENQVDQVDKAMTGITWASQPDQEGLTITGVQFFSDAKKTKQVTPSYLDLPGSNWGRMNWVIQFKPVKIDVEETLYYVLTYKDSKYNNLQWDPQLKIEPRGKG